MKHVEPSQTFKKLDGKVAVVTGAAGNLGPIWIKALRDEGAVVYALAYPGSEDDPCLLDFKNDPNIIILDCDVTNDKSLTNAAKIVSSKWQALDILIASAGIDQSPQISMSKKYKNVEINSFNNVLSVNIVGVFQTLQTFGKLMIAQKKGSIILIGSLYASVSPDPSLYDHLIPKFIKPPAYGASKAAVVQLGKYFAVHWGQFNIRVNTLSPGGVFANQDQNFIQKYSDRVPLGRMAKHSDLTGPLIFLASEDSKYVSGINLIVDGGFTAL